MLRSHSVYTSALALHCHPSWSSGTLSLHHNQLPLRVPDEPLFLRLFVRTQPAHSTFHLFSCSSPQPISPVFLSLRGIPFSLPSHSLDFSHLLRFSSIPLPRPLMSPGRLLRETQGWDGVSLHVLLIPPAPSFMNHSSSLYNALCCLQTGSRSCLERQLCGNIHAATESFYFLNYLPSAGYLMQISRSLLTNFISFSANPSFLLVSAHSLVPVTL